jgi:hypothetical protein
MPTTTHDFSHVFIELGLAVVGLAVLARLANRWGFSAIPLYLLAGLAFGNGGLAPLKLTENFIHIGAEIGVLLLLFMLGLEYSGDELKANLRVGFPAGVADFVLNFTPGLMAGLLLHSWPLRIRQPARRERPDASCLPESNIQPVYTDRNRYKCLLNALLSMIGFESRIRLHGLQARSGLNLRKNMAVETAETISVTDTVGVPHGIRSRR